MPKTVFVCHRHFNDPMKMGIFEYRVTKSINDPQIIMKIIRDYYNHFSQTQIARNHQLESNHIASFFRKNNLPKFPKKHELAVNLIIDGYLNQYKSTYELAEEYNCSSTTIMVLLNKNGVKLRTGGESRTLHVRRKLDIKQILDDFVNKRKSAYELAKEHNCSTGTIYDILKENKVKLHAPGEAQRKYIANETFFDQIDSEIKAYILGFLYADGYNDEKNHIIKLNLSKKDLEILEKIRDALSPDSKIYHYIIPKFPEKEYICLSIRNKHMCEALANLGCMQAKTFKLTFPTFIPKNLVHHFIRGYSDGDGCISFSAKSGCKPYDYTMLGTESFINGVSEIFKTETDVNYGIMKINPDRTNITRLKIGGNRQVKRVLDWVYQDATILMQRKYERYLGLCRQCAGTDIKLAEPIKKPYVAKRRTKAVPNPIIVPIPKTVLKLVIVPDDNTAKLEPDNANPEDDIEFDENLELEPDEDELKFGHDAIRMDDDDLRYGDERFDYENLELEPDEDELELDDEQLEDA